MQPVQHRFKPSAYQIEYAKAPTSPLVGRVSINWEKITRICNVVIIVAMMIQLFFLKLPMLALGTITWGVIYAASLRNASSPAAYQNVLDERDAIRKEHKTLLEKIKSKKQLDQNFKEKQTLQKNMEAKIQRLTKEIASLRAVRDAEKVANKKQK